MNFGYLGNSGNYYITKFFRWVSHACENEDEGKFNCAEKLQNYKFSQRDVKYLWKQA